MEATGDAVCAVGFRQGQNLLLFTGNTAERTVTTSVRVHDHLSGSYRLCTFDSLIDEWVEGEERIPAEDLMRGLIVKLERKGFCVLELRQEV
jgi:hypothetical protein